MCRAGGRGDSGSRRRAATPKWRCSVHRSPAARGRPGRPPARRAWSHRAGPSHGRRVAGVGGERATRWVEGVYRRLRGVSRRPAAMCDDVARVEPRAEVAQACERLLQAGERRARDVQARSSAGARAARGRWSSCAPRPSTRSVEHGCSVEAGVNTSASPTCSTCPRPWGRASAAASSAETGADSPTASGVGAVGEHARGQRREPRRRQRRRRGGVGDRPGASRARRPCWVRASPARRPRRAPRRAPAQRDDRPAVSWAKP